MTEAEMDIINKQARSELMARIQSKNTRPEIAVRSLLHRMGYRFRLHRKDLPGKPDIVLPRHRKIIMIHGCFWHGHTCRLASRPKSNRAYWEEKIRANRARDRDVQDQLRMLGWSVLVLWECDIRKATGLSEKIRAFMNQ